MPASDGPVPVPLPVDTSLAGRVFALVESRADPDGWWVPMVNGTDRLGAINFVVTGSAVQHDEAVRGRLETLAGLVVTSSR